MKKIASILFILLTLSGCIGVSSQGVLGTGVNVYLDPRTLGTQIDDSINIRDSNRRFYNAKIFLN